MSKALEKLIMEYGYSTIITMVACILDCDETATNKNAVAELKEIAKKIG
jgi:hypothetical protein